MTTKEKPCLATGLEPSPGPTKCPNKTEYWQSTDAQTCSSARPWLVFLSSWDNFVSLKYISTSSVLVTPESAVFSLGLSPELQTLCIGGYANISSCPQTQMAQPECTTPFFSASFCLYSLSLSLHPPSLSFSLPLTQATILRSYCAVLSPSPSNDRILLIDNPSLLSHL